MCYYKLNVWSIRSFSIVYKFNLEIDFFFLASKLYVIVSGAKRRTTSALKTCFRTVTIK